MENNDIYKPSKISAKTIRRMLRYARPYIGWFVLAIALIFAIVFLELRQPILLGEAIDTIENSATSNNSNLGTEIVIIGLKYAGVVVLALVLTYIQAMVLAYIGQKIVYKIRHDVFEHLQGLSVSFFDGNPIGRLVTRATNDIDTLNEMYTSVIVNMVKSVCVLGGIIITMISLNLQLSLLTFIVLPFIAIFTAIFSVTSKKTYREIRVKVAALNAFVSEHVSGMKIVQIFAVENKMLNKFKERSEQLRKNHMKQITIFALYSPSTYLLNITALIMLIWFGGKMYFDGIIGISTIVIFQRYIGKFFEPIQEFAEQINIVQSASG